MSSSKDIAVFLDGHLHLLKKERDAEIEQTGLLLSRCAPKLLEQRGLALLNLSVVGITVGLGGKRYEMSVSFEEVSLIERSVAVLSN